MERVEGVEGRKKKNWVPFKSGKEKKVRKIPQISQWNLGYTEGIEKKGGEEEDVKEG